MKKFLILFAAFMLTLTLAGCNGDSNELPEIPEEVTMDTVDDFLGRPDVQYVDLRNFDDKMKSGYIAGFEFIPFFDYLELEDILVRTDGDWTFAAEDILSQAGLRGLFDEDKTIFLMCGSGTRAGFVLAALEELGYENVINVGGISSYEGDNMVDGDGTYRLNADVAGPYTPGTYYGVDPMTGYQVVVVINAHGGIEDVVFDAAYHGTTKNALDTAYTLGSGVTWKAEAEMLADYIVANQGWKDIELTEEAYDANWNALTVPHHIIDIDVEASPDGVAGVTIGAEGFVFAWNLAIAQASSTDEGVVATAVTYEQWVAAHAPAFDYVDGVYFGMDEAHGYYVKVTIEDGVIIDVFFDALYDVYLGCDVDGTFDDTVAKADCGDVATETKVYEETTKQVLQGDYTLASGVTWAAEADELAAAIIDAQEWVAGWVIIPGTDGGHDKFDMDDTDTADAVGGVTIGIEGFKAAWEEAIAQAMPSS
jgi:rhodanese-related sulfurtransferase